MYARTHVVRRFVAATLFALASVSAHAETMEIVYFHTDATGSPTAAFNEDGEVCWRANYTAYGQLERVNSDPMPDGCGLLEDDDLGFTGHVQDSSGLVYAQQRYYDPQIGRFLSTDPVLPHAGDPRYFGRYHYGANNPYRYTDPTGEDFIEGVGAFFSEVGSWLSGDGFDGDRVSSAFANGYDDGVGSAVTTAVGDALIVVDVINTPISPGPDVGLIGAGMKLGDKAHDAYRASTPVGRKKYHLGGFDSKKPTNAPGTVGGRDYSGHAFDNMQSQGIVPSAVEEAVKNGNRLDGKVPGTTAYHDTTNNLTVITDTASGKVVTVDRGLIKQ